MIRTALGFHIYTEHAGWNNATSLRGFTCQVNVEASAYSLGGTAQLSIGEYHLSKNGFVQMLSSESVLKKKGQLCFSDQND